MDIIFLHIRENDVVYFFHSKMLMYGFVNYQCNFMLCMTLMNEFNHDSGRGEDYKTVESLVG